MSEGSTIEGVVVDVSQRSSKVTLDQVTFVDTAVQHPLFEQLHFYAQEISSFIGTPDDLPNLRRPIATDFEVIDEVNDQLSEAVVASSKVYVFDVQKMKKDLFGHGLKEIFESDGIEKVADVIIYINKKLESGDFQFPPYVRDVQSCLRTFLNLTGDQLKYTRSRQKNEDQACTWGQRPLSLRQIDALVKDVVYLGELAHVCLEQMLQKFRAGVGILSWPGSRLQ
ncbi:hypothetical protein MRX96_005389 [Rhipicephalus microplus]